MTDPVLRAVIFDLDGVLVDTSRHHAAAWARLVRSLGHNPPDDLEERIKGIARLAAVRVALGQHASQYSDAELAALADRKNAWYVESIRGIGPKDLYPGARELFEDLRRAGIAAVLGSASKNARTVLEKLGIADDFSAIADGFSFTHPKPDPDVFLAAARLAGVRPEECIVVEDAAAGIDAALAGGFVAVGIGTYESLKHAHLYVRSLTELSAARLKDLHARHGRRS